MLKYKIGEQVRINDRLYVVKSTTIEEHEDYGTLEIYFEKVEEKETKNVDNVSLNEFYEIADEMEKK